ncbi:L-threonylcarbamoyladenylate synthase [Bacteroidetes bacterium endosymbiont of Geopemphigus sp.]|uniref:L-threonylcarbamoyladenylate synthase n=1 Tax=Bacteroidetes bacterium endosymbiont of Geopemphigus sp. TaxID=2047937 RepID=UPI000CD2A946|nr:L-threonylcarbamoyladenylate synthase [Bacteroidetes bacterium endosymbiont of Geopemphigus sp.]
MSEKFSQELFRSFETLKQGGILLYPTDTVWGIGCDPTNLKAVQKLYEIKRRSTQKPMILLVSCAQMLRCIVKVPRKAWHLMAKTSRPLTIIYDYPTALFSALSASDGALAVRITSDTFCQELIKSLGGPLISTSANLSGDPTPLSFCQISSDILEAVDYIVDLRRKDQATYASSSLIVRCNEDESWQILRK